MWTFQSEVYTHTNRSDWPTELKGIFKCSPFELHPSRAPAAADRGLGGWAVGRGERQWELQDVVTNAETGKRQRQFMLVVLINVTEIFPFLFETIH